MSNTLQGFFFDLDGTLLDSAQDILAIVKRMAQEHQQELPAEDWMRAGVSGGVALVLARVFQRAKNDLFIEEMRQQFMAEFSHSSYSQTHLFPGVEELLSKLDQYQLPWGIITNKSRLLSEHVIATIPQLQKAHVLICGDDLPLSKPNPQGLLSAAKQTHCNPQFCWYLGDSEADMRAARAAKMKPLLAAWGYIAETEKVEKWAYEEQFASVQQLQISLEHHIHNGD